MLQKPQLWPKPCLKILDNTKSVTHTNGRTPLTSYQLVAQTATYTTHYKRNRRISMPSARFEPAIAEIKELQTTPKIVWQPGSAGTYSHNITFCLIWNSEYRRLEINSNVDIAFTLRDSKRNYRYESRNFQTNTVHSYQTERHFISKTHFV
jgi:hypothetical protein